MDDSKYLIVVHPYPLNANLELDADQRELALWLACCAGKDVIRAIFHKPFVSLSSASFPFFISPERQSTHSAKSTEMVVIEVDREFDRFHELLGLHVWSEFLMEPNKEQMDESSTVLYSTFNTSRLVNSGTSCIALLWFVTHVSRRLEASKHRGTLVSRMDPQRFVSGVSTFSRITLIVS